MITLGRHQLGNITFITRRNLKQFYHLISDGCALAESLYLTHEIVHQNSCMHFDYVAGRGWLPRAGRDVSADAVDDRTGASSGSVRTYHKKTELYVLGRIT